MGIIRQIFGYVWGISSATITFLRLLQLLEVRPDDALNNIGGGFGTFVLSVANVFGDVLNGLATWIAEQVTGETAPPPCAAPCTEESLFIMSEELQSTLFYSQYGTLAVVTILFLLIFFLLIRR